jgi:hypothetical protein
MSEISRRGRILRAIERAFIASRRSEVSTSEIMQFAFALPLYRGRHSAQDRRLFSRSILRAAPRLCDRVGKAKSRGAPWLWKLREPETTLREMVWRQSKKGDFLI